MSDSPWSGTSVAGSLFSPHHLGGQHRLHGQEESEVPLTGEQDAWTPRVAEGPREPVGGRLFYQLHVRALHPESIGYVRRLVAARLRCWGAGGDVMEDVLLCLSELLSNVVCHAGASSCVLLMENGPVLRLTVRDFSTDLPVLRPTEGLQESGRGMRLVTALASRWGAETTACGKDVWAEFGQRLSAIGPISTPTTDSPTSSPAGALAVRRIANPG
jgi:anti-sigma regulatory factor (Ser/Thr protein kinase)